MDGNTQLAMQTCMLPFQIAIKAVTIVRYLSDHVTSIPLSCMTRMLNTCDFPVLLVQLATRPPWGRERNGKMEAACLLSVKPTRNASVEKRQTVGRI
jgi:hypothetical protein